LVRAEAHIVTAREAILRATLRVVGEHGVAGSTNRRIATVAGVSLGSLTYHFPDQQQLLRETLLLFAEDETRRIRDTALRYSTANLGVEQAAATVQRVLEQLSLGNNEIAPIELYLHAGRNPGLREATTRCFAAYDELASTILHALGLHDPDRLVEPVVALLTGLQLRRLATGTTSAAPAAEALTMLADGAHQR